jgi:hypothetical protein
MQFLLDAGYRLQWKYMLHTTHGGPGKATMSFYGKLSFCMIAAMELCMLVKVAYSHLPGVRGKKSFLSGFVDGALPEEETELYVNMYRTFKGKKLTDSDVVQFGETIVHGEQILAVHDASNRAYDLFCPKLKRHARLQKPEHNSAYMAGKREGSICASKGKRMATLEVKDR